MISHLLLSDYLQIAHKTAVVDVRSEDEYKQGHIPNAVNLPLLNNQERAIVGTLYKQKGNREAVQKGFELTGGKFAEFIEQAKALSVNNTISVYCWRGGMRSNIMAWLFSTAGYEVNLLKGGYKVFRNFALQQLDIKRNYLILGGKTGSGKTEMLQHLKNQGEQVVDLEALAHHKGSAFGALGQAEQPSNEQFENNLFWELNWLSDSKTIWLENESRLIGKNKLPDALYEQMRNASVVEMLLPLELRVQRILAEYGTFPTETLANITRKIEKKLGNLRMNQAITHLQNNELKQWALMMLVYYDDFYAYGLEKRAQSSISYAILDSLAYAQQVHKVLAQKKEFHSEAK
jgi:tRNA 2-selenouridine synthase